MNIKNGTGMIIAAALLLALALLMACGGDAGGGDLGGGSGEANGGGATETAANIPIVVSQGQDVLGGEQVEMAADFPIIVSQGQDVLGGEQVAMASLVGEMPIVMNFWAAECPPCRAELPEFQKFYGEYRDEVLVLGIDLGQFTFQGTPEQGRELLAELGVSFPAGHTEDSEILPKYRVLGLPTTVFINADGSIHDKWTGALNEETLIEKAEEMLER